MCVAGRCCGADKIYIVQGAHFRCANVRKRLVLIGFLDSAHLDAFTPPPPQAASPTPLSAVLKRYSSADLFVSRHQLQGADKRSHVVGLGYIHGAHSPTSAYAVNTPGTLLAINSKFDTLET